MPLSLSVKDVVGQAMPKKLMVIGRLLSDWETIMRDLPAQRCVPLKLKNAHDKHKKILCLAVASGDAMDVDYAKRQILERINQYLGENLVVDLVLKQTDLSVITRNISPNKHELSHEQASNSADKTLTLSQQLESFWQTLQNRQKNNKG